MKNISFVGICWVCLSVTYLSCIMIMKPKIHRIEPSPKRLQYVFPCGAHPLKTLENWRLQKPMWALLSRGLPGASQSSRSRRCSPAWHWTWAAGGSRTARPPPAHYGTEGWATGCLCNSHSSPGPAGSGRNKENNERKTSNNKCYGKPGLELFDCNSIMTMQTFSN